MERRQELDNRPDLLTVIGFLKREQELKANNDRPKLPEGLDGGKLRDLPGFLEPIGTYLEYNPATFRKAYGFFAEEVALCANSELMWADDKKYDESVYWRSFNRFVNATKTHSPTHFQYL
jgi:hypothetical protein